jgi:hypothetical protein
MPINTHPVAVGDCRFTQSCSPESSIWFDASWDKSRKFWFHASPRILGPFCLSAEVNLTLNRGSAESHRSWLMNLDSSLESCSEFEYLRPSDGNPTSQVESDKRTFKPMDSWNAHRAGSNQASPRHGNGPRRTTGGFITLAAIVVGGRQCFPNVQSQGRSFTLEDSSF